MHIVTRSVAQLVDDAAAACDFRLPSQRVQLLKSFKTAATSWGERRVEEQQLVDVLRKLRLMLQMVWDMREFRDPSSDPDLKGHIV